MQSKLLNALDAQALLPMGAHSAEEVSDTVVRRQPSLMRAVALCIQCSGLEEKQIYRPLGIDAGHWTRMTKGEAHFPLDKLGDLMTLCGNEIPLMWLAWSRGKGLVMLEGEAERQLRIANESLAAANDKVAYLEALVTGKVGK